MDAKIETFDLTKRFKDLVAVDHLNLKVEDGEIFGLLGPNGAGKTTLISMLATLIKPTGGGARVDGYDILREPSKVRRSIGMVFQDPSSDDILTGRENLYLHCLMYHVPSGLREKRIREILRLVDLEARADDLVKTYSGGMRRRLELGRGLLHHPRILFLDEPTLGLDPQSREHVWEYIRRMVEGEGITMILTTHYMDEADSLCDRVAIIDSGRIVAMDTPSSLKKAVGGDIIEIRVRQPDTDLFRSLPYVSKVEAKGEILTLTVQDADRHIQEILRMADGVESVQMRTATLNDVFLSFTGREIRSENAEGGWLQRVARARSRGR